MSCRILVAGLGNIFLGDDGFGVEVVRRLSAETLPGSVRVGDFGIRALHLAYELADGGYENTILIDAARMGDKPGTVYLIKPDLDTIFSDSSEFPDGHAMDFRLVLRLVRSLSGKTGDIYIVGCEPLQFEDQIGLSKPVAAAVNEALKLIHERLAEWEQIRADHA
ncbi:MAG: peptidase M52 [Acidobacteria bacterium]|nr:MAG: peptidase M52 [Verrucomicrobiota bacterium]PYS46925.1 MAG: peptidase M52 [Acidobacteriota bacterium]